LKIQKKEIKRRTYLILFGLLPLFLFVFGFCFAIITNMGWFSFLFYIPLWINLVISWFFKSEQYTSIFERIPKKIKDVFFIIFLVFILFIVPIIGFFCIIDINPLDKIPFVLKNDIILLFVGSTLICCSCIIWIMILYALNVFRSIRFYSSNYFFTIMSLILFISLFIKWFETDEFYFLITAFLSFMLCIGVTIRRCISYV